MKHPRPRLLASTAVAATLLAAGCADASQQSAPDTGTPPAAQAAPIPPGATPVLYSSYIFVQARVDSVDAHLLVDAAARNLYLDGHYYYGNDFDHENIMPAKITGIGNSSQSVNVIKDTVRFAFGGRDFATRMVPILRLKPIGGDYVDGIVGMRFFDGQALRIDYKSGYIAVADTLDPATVEGFTRLHMSRVDHYYCVPARLEVDGAVVEGDFIIDTGMPITTLTSSAAQAHDLGAKIKRKVRYYNLYGGVGGESESHEFLAGSLEVGGARLRGVYMAYSNDDAGVLADGRYVGILGNNVLDRFDVVFDFDAEDLYLRPNASFSDPYVFDRLGFSYVDRSTTMGGWIVTGLTEGSPAERCGLQAEDRITALNGTPVREIPLADQKALFESLAEAHLTVSRDGEPQQFVFELAPLLP